METKDKPVRDSIAMYLIVNRELNMSGWKVAAQVGHAVMQLTLKYRDIMNVHGNESKGFHEYALAHFKTFKEWLEEPTKIVLGANKEEWEAIKNTIPHSMVIDAGYTEIPAHSETIIGLWPVRKSEAPPIIRSLKTS